MALKNKNNPQPTAPVVPVVEKVEEAVIKVAEVKKPDMAAIMALKNKNNPQASTPAVPVNMPVVERPSPTENEAIHHAVITKPDPAAIAALKNKKSQGATSKPEEPTAEQPKPESQIPLTEIKKVDPAKLAAIKNKTKPPEPKEETKSEPAIIKDAEISKPSDSAILAAKMKASSKIKTNLPLIMEESYKSEIPSEISRSTHPNPNSNSQTQNQNQIQTQQIPQQTPIYQPLPNLGPGYLGLPIPKLNIKSMFFEIFKENFGDLVLALKQEIENPGKNMAGQDIQAMSLLKSFAGKVGNLPYDHRVYVNRLLDGLPDQIVNFVTQRTEPQGYNQFPSFPSIPTFQPNQQNYQPQYAQPSQLSFQSSTQTIS